MGMVPAGTMPTLTSLDLINEIDSCVTLSQYLKLVEREKTYSRFYEGSLTRAMAKHIL